MVTEYESPNLPALTDVPVIEDRVLMEYLIGLKELIETMLGRRGDQALTPQMQVGKYWGDGRTVERLIATHFRPKYVKLWVDPEHYAAGEYMYERLDDKEQDVDWVDYSFRHSDATNKHDFVNTTGITSITDDGFYVYGDTLGTAFPNAVGYYYDWIALG